MNKRTFEVNGYVFRVCRACNQKLELNADNFHRDAHESGGFKYVCKTCATLPNEIIPEGFARCTGPLHNGALLPIENFSPRNDAKKSVQSHCKECRKEAYYRSTQRKRRKERYIVPGVVRQCAGTFCGGQIYPDTDEYFHNEKNRIYCKTCKSHYKKQPDKRALANKVSLNRYHRMKNDPEFKLIKNTRARISKTLKRLSINESYKGKKGNKLVNVIGCSPQELKKHIENHPDFKPPISWENYGSVWHLDHIKAIATFDLADPLAFYSCFHYKNLRPCLSHENLSKSAKKTPLEKENTFSHEDIQEILVKARELNNIQRKVS
jgi:hypothetical protein